MIDESLQPLIGDIMNDPHAVLKSIADLRAKRAEQEVLLKRLETLAHVALQGVDVSEGVTLGFSANDISYEQLQALRREHPRPSILVTHGGSDKLFLDWLAERFYNIVTHKNGDVVVLAPMIAQS